MDNNLSSGSCANVVVRSNTEIWVTGETDGGSSWAQQEFPVSFGLNSFELFVTRMDENLVAITEYREDAGSVQRFPQAATATGDGIAIFSSTSESEQLVFNITRNSDDFCSPAPVSVGASVGQFRKYSALEYFIHDSSDCVGKPSPLSAIVLLASHCPSLLRTRNSLHWLPCTLTRTVAVIPFGDISAYGAVGVSSVPGTTNALITMGAGYSSFIGSVEDPVILEFGGIIIDEEGTNVATINLKGSDSLMGGTVPAISTQSSLVFVGVTSVEGVTVGGCGSLEARNSTSAYVAATNSFGDCFVAEYVLDHNDTASSTPVALTSTDETVYIFLEVFGPFSFGGDDYFGMGETFLVTYDLQFKEFVAITTLDRSILRITGAPPALSYLDNTFIATGLNYSSSLPLGGGSIFKASFDGSVEWEIPWSCDGTGSGAVVSVKSDRFFAIIQCAGNLTVQQAYTSPDDTPRTLILRVTEDGQVIGAVDLTYMGIFPVTMEIGRGTLQFMIDVPPSMLISGFPVQES